MKLIAGILIGWASASALMFAAICWRSLREADNAGLRALADFQPIVHDPHWADTLLDHILWADELTDKDT